MRAISRLAPLTATALLLGALPLALAHGHDDAGDMDMNMDMDMSIPTPSAAAASAPSAGASYFSYTEHVGLIYTHIILMVIGWLFVLPIAIILSLANCRLTLLSQLCFLGVNGLGIFFGTLYNAQTPDLYENNAHHKFGWVVTWIFVAQVLMGLVSLYARRRSAKSDASYGVPLSLATMAEHQPLNEEAHPYRWSNDSGHGTDRNSGSLRSDSLSPTEERERLFGDANRPYGVTDDDDQDSLGEVEKRGFLKNTAVDRFLTRKIPSILSSRAVRAIGVVYDILDRFMLILGFVAVLTGMITFGGVCKERQIFSCLAHFIKGGIFFWYGLLTLGRWMGCFADLGWAWNVKPPKAVVGSWKARVPSGEFTESFVIFLYGSSNVFLEHLNAWGAAWSPMDLEHVSIAILFFGGGLCGMLVESTWVSNLLNSSLLRASANDVRRAEDADPLWQAPRSETTPKNPLPALVILLLGLMMSGHHQNSMVSTMVHKQWGTLLMGFSFARAVTYIILYLAPPSSYLPSRPPSELIASFCLISGGIIFMASNSSTMSAMEQYDVDAMFVFAVTMGFTAFLMGWEVLVLAIKGWALRRENKADFTSRIAA